MYITFHAATCSLNVHTILGIPSLQSGSPSRFASVLSLLHLDVLFDTIRLFKLRIELPAHNDDAVARQKESKKGALAHPEAV